MAKFENQARPKIDKLLSRLGVLKVFEVPSVFNVKVDAANSATAYDGIDSAMLDRLRGLMLPHMLRVGLTRVKNKAS